MAILLLPRAVHHFRALEGIEDWIQFSAVAPSLTEDGAAVVGSGSSVGRLLVGAGDGGSGGEKGLRAKLGVRGSDNARAPV